MSALPCRADDGLFAAAEQVFGNIKTFLCSPEASSLSHSDLEWMLGVKGRELLRQLLQDHLNLRSPGARCGGLDPCARTASRAGARNHLRDCDGIARRLWRRGETEPAPAGQLNLPVEKYSHEVLRNVAIEAAKDAFDEGIETLERYTGARVPKRQFEELVSRDGARF